MCSGRATMQPDANAADHAELWKQLQGLRNLFYTMRIPKPEDSDYGAWEQMLDEIRRLQHRLAELGHRCG